MRSGDLAFSISILVKGSLERKYFLNRKSRTKNTEKLFYFIQGLSCYFPTSLSLVGQKEHNSCSQMIWIYLVSISLSFSYIKGKDKIGRYLNSLVVKYIYEREHIYIYIHIILVLCYIYKEIYTKEDIYICIYTYIYRPINLSVSLLLTLYTAEPYLTYKSKP